MRSAVDGSQFSRDETVTRAAESPAPASGRDGSQSGKKADRHTDRHTVNHSRQKAGDGVTVVTVVDVPVDPKPQREVFDI
jgi:hypothetical protein